MQEPVGEVAAEGMGEVESAFGPPAGQVSARSDAVEHQPTHDTAPGLLGLGDDLGE
ncbi:hypothetical protein [Streptomyces rimosus]|uniref:hypothetical protein n=1 Tax=Streptomyces rimosus TaxID=1927 RepID=UPI001F3BA982|nr:hypothetical protein [Streptomyces rimosus]